ncbi:MAG: hypothetical protein HYV33_04020 [Candidatus Kerfeldbacteria bacterium]|nr:hypothetical protein [Candidatus Kerfeldbacteria bacterium]
MKYQKFKKDINKPFFSTQEAYIRRIPLYASQLSLWKKQGYIGTLKRGLHYFVEYKELIIPEEISFLLYQPSYISLEWALYHYGVIPDITHAITAITTKVTRTFTNDFGHFIYRNLKPALFFGYTVETTRSRKYLLAELEKALLDYLYLNLGQIDRADDLSELRFNYHELATILYPTKFQHYAALFHSKKLQHISNLILQQCSPSLN